MKANAPERLYLYPYSTDEIYEVETKPLEGTIEYTQTNAFIEKACSYIRLYSALLDTENNDCMPEWLDKFRNAMKK